MAETAVLAPLGWVVSPLLKTLVDKARELLGTSLDEKIKKLEATALPRLSLAIEKAEMSPNKDQLQDWLQRLKGAYYDAEEAIDLLEYQILKQKVEVFERTTCIKFPTQAKFSEAGPSGTANEEEDDDEEEQKIVLETRRRHRL